MADSKTEYMFYAEEKGEILGSTIFKDISNIQFDVDGLLHVVCQYDVIIWSALNTQSHITTHT